MKKTRRSGEDFESLERLAHDTSDLRPMTAAMRKRWEAAKQTGAAPRRGRPAKAPHLKARIVPISMDPALLDAVDRFAKANGVSRSKLVAEGLRLRLRRTG